MPELKTIDDLTKGKASLKGKKILVRVDLNVPMDKGRVSDDTRITRILPTIKKLVEQKAKVILLSHFGRPEGEFVRDFSLAPLVDVLSDHLDMEVRFGVDCVGVLAKLAVDGMKEGEVLLLENLRFHKEEKENSKAFAKEIASLGDYYVNDAFACSHRKHASIVGLAELLPSAAGLLMEREIKHLSDVMVEPKKPVAAIVGGSKVSTKIDLLKSLVKKVDYLFIGGGMANTFLHAKGFKVGQSICEKSLKSTALKIIEQAEKRGCEIMIPSDAIVAPTLSESPKCKVVSVKNIPEKEMILDIGPRTVHEWGTKLENCKTVVWNGPLGAFEVIPFDVGTTSVARVISGLTGSGSLKSVAGGGDIIAALSRGGLRHSLTYISTAGGAFLEWLEGKDLPGVKVLRKND